MSQLDNILQHLSGVRKTGEHQWLAKCPAHDDQHASFSIGRGNDGRPLLYCQAGCKTEDVVQAMGLKLGDLFPSNGADPIAPQKPAPQARKPFPQEADVLACVERQTRGKHVASWVYCYPDGREALRVGRFNFPDGEKTYRPYYEDSSGWHLGDPPGPLPLYRLADVTSTHAVYVVEGEKCVDIAAKLGLVATTSAHGAKAPAKTDWRPLAGKDIVVLPDAGQAGAEYAGAVVANCRKLDVPPASVRIVELPDLADGEDIEQFVERRDSRTKEEIVAEIESLQPVAPPVTTPKPPPPSKGKESQATALVRFALEEDLFHDPGGESWATITADGHHETHAIRSRGFRRWLAEKFYGERQQAPTSGAVVDALTVLEGKAVFDGAERPCYIRVAGHDGAYYIDLGDRDWRAIKIAAGEWQCVDNPPVRFRRPKGLLALPVPERGGSLDELRGLVNVATEADWYLLVAWLTAAFRPIGPYPTFNAIGEHGSAKSTLMRLARGFIDPNQADLRSEPREGRDLAIAAHNGWLLMFDNLSSVLPWLSDGLCRLATGGGFATRELYSDYDETILDAMRPVAVNGIENIATRGDLADRCITLRLPTIPPERRCTESAYWEKVTRAAPRTLGALLDAVSLALRLLPTVTLPATPRMADFAVWGVAVERALGWLDGAFLNAYTANRQTTNETALESSPAVTTIVDVLSRDGYAGEWRGTSKELLALIDGEVDEKTRKLKVWPKTPRGLSSILRRLAPNLRETGWAVTFPEDHPSTHDHQRIMLIEHTRGEE